MNTPTYVGTLALLAMTLITATACADLDGVTPQNGTSAPADWSPPFVATWNFDEASGTRAASGGSCSAGSDCDLTDNNTVTQDTTNFKEGVAAADFTRANDESLSCLNATCDELIAPAGGSFTVGCFFRTDDTAGDQGLFDTLEAGATAGFAITRTTATSLMDFKIADSGGVILMTAGVDSWPLNTWTHLVGRFDNDADAMSVVVNGVQIGGTTTQDDIGASGDPFVIGSNETIDPSGQADECFYIDQALTDAQICRMCSCGIDGDNDIGNEKCLCSGADATVYAANGRNTTQCGGCTLPACNAVAP